MLINPSVDKDYGVYRAIVASNQDASKLGRIKIRIPCFHGDNETGIKDKDLPWATICMMGASAQSGSFVVPEVGSTVMVQFENGNHSSPVVMGGVYSKGKREPRTLSQSPESYLEDIGDIIENLFMKKKPKGRMVPAFLHDVIEAAQQDTATKVIYRSPKGAQILMKDRDGGETLDIIDANGQFLKFLSPMRSDKIMDNKHKYSSPKDNLFSRARTILSNGLGQFLSFISNGSDSDIDLVDTVNQMGIEIDGNEKMCRFFSQSGVKVEVIMKDDKISIQSPGAFVDVSEDTVTVKGTNIILEAPDITINGSSVKINGEIKCNGSLTVEGPLVSGGVNMASHYHWAPHEAGNTTKPKGSGGSGGPTYEAPKIEIKEWEEEV